MRRLFRNIGLLAGIVPADIRRKEGAAMDEVATLADAWLLTDDGQLAHKMISPKHHVTKYYLAKLRDPFSEDDIAAFRAGIMLREGDREESCLPAECQEAGDHLAVLALTEGKYHQVRRMFAAAGNHVEQLLRVQIGALALPP